MTPLVSVLMPVFNAADTLAVALASLQAQTYERWECVLVDDGSRDHPERLIERLCESRIQYQRLEHNRGRGYARQRALEIAKGKYVAFLDGDDWMHPTKLQQQVQLLEAEPDLVLVSTGMATANLRGELVGVRTTPKNEPVVRAVMNRLGTPSLAFAPSMMRTHLAKNTGFDISFPTSEDADFLLRALLGKQYAILTAPLYVYREQGSTTLGKVSPALSYSCRMFLRHFDQYSVDSAIEIAKARGKQMIYHCAAAFGLWNHIIARRSRVPNADERGQYQQAWDVVSAIANSYAFRVSQPAISLLAQD
jgi:glycosyltransferase involved in cell wall biosynthesis